MNIMLLSMFEVKKSKTDIGPLTSREGKHSK